MSSHQVLSAPSSPSWRLTDGFVGVGYLLMTLSCMTYFVSVLTPSLTNDLYWPTYNRTGFAIFLIDLINNQLQTASTSPISTPLDLLSVMMLKSYESDVVQATFDSSTGRRILLEEMNEIERAVRDTRTATPPGVAHLYAQYCWVDLERRWDIAHTRARALRCSEKYSDDAAKYLETVLRNTNWTNFELTYRDMWGVCIGWAVAKSVGGQQWLSDRPRHALALSVSDEVAFLQSYNLSKFTLQWHNDYGMSLTETIEVENALSQRQTVILKAIPFDRAPWTTVTMYWAFRNDLGAMVYFNTSLVRGDARHFEAVLGWTFSSMYGLADRNGQYHDQIALFFYNIGPFGSVDLNLVPRPPALLALYTEFGRLLLEQVWSQPALWAAFVAIPKIVLTPLPPKFSQEEWLFFGGNPLCLYNRPTHFPQSQLAFDDSCSQSQLLTMAASREALLFAVLASRGPVNASTCAMQYTSSGQGTQDCISVLRATTTVGRAMSVESVSDFSQLVASAIGALPPLQLFQYAKSVGSPVKSEWALLQQPLLDPTDVSWSFFGWLALFDWMQGTREAIVFDGDVATVYAISEVNPVTVLPSTSQSQGDQSGPQTIYVLVVYMTAVSVALGAVVLLYVLRLQWTGGRFEGRNLLAFNRVTALVWVGRPLLLLRGLTAILMLSSTTTSLVQELGYSKLVATTRSPWNTLVVAGEATWVTYVVTDVLLVACGDAGAVVAPLSSALSFGAIVLLDLLQPISLVATLNRRCTAIEIGKGLDCTCGVVRTGDSSRILLLLGMQGVAMVVGGVVAFAWSQRKPRARGGRDMAPLVLHGAAATFLRHGRFHDHDAWQLDDVACVMTGLLPFAWRGQHHTFDVKLWVLVPDSDKCRRQLNQLMSFHKPSFNLSRVRVPSNKACVKTALVRVGLWWRRVAILTGVLYILISGFGSVSYIAVSTVNFANDFYWASFNMTGHHAVIADWFNHQLPLRRNRSVVAVRLDQRCWATFASNFSSPRNAAAYATLYGTTLQAGTAEATKLDVVIAGLRRSSPCEVPWISTQYCWVDFDRRWPLASSNARQKRCLSEVANGAVYLEAVLRNVEWSAWAKCWGTSFDVGIGDELQMSLEGRAWLKMVSMSPWTSASDEVDRWTRAGIAEFVVQWQNYKSLGLINTYTIETALGVQYPMTLSRVNGSYSLASQATFKMYWAFASDLWAVADNSTLLGGKSLVATSANYAFQNQSTMFMTLVQNGTVATPLHEAFAVFHRDIGPYGSVDMKILPCPPAVQTLLATGYGILRETLASASLNASLAYFSIPIESPLVVPSKYKRIPRGLSLGVVYVPTSIPPTSPSACGS